VVAFVKDLIVIPSLVVTSKERRKKFRLLKTLVLKEQKQTASMKN
jgi:hypothetical protein